MSKNQTKVCATLNYIEHFPILTSWVTGCISIADLLLCLVFL